MLKETREIENATVAKLNCMLFAANKVSLPNVELMMKKEAELGEKSQQMYLDFSKRLNDLINVYFRAVKGEDIELKIAGNARERADMMPLLYVDNEETKKQLGAQMVGVLE